MKNCIIALCFLLAVGEVSAQSYHFSQFFSTPLLTNPANTGFAEGAYRISSNFRSQGMPGGNTFFTGYLSGDISPLKKQLSEGHKAGLGMYIMNDQSLNSALQTNSIGMSAAYHVGLDTYGEQSFGLGVQGTYNQRRLDYSKLTFENQYGPGGYDASLPLGEALGFNSQNFFDLNAGIVYNRNLEDKAIFAGISVYNILRHKENLTANEFKIPTRFVIQGGAQFFIGEYGKVYTSLTTMSQANANQITVGGAYGQTLTTGEKNELMLGLWYRHKDALIPYAGLQFSGFQVGLSYDYTISPIKTSAQLRNGYELTLQYKPADNKELKTLIPWY